MLDNLVSSTVVDTDHDSCSTKKTLFSTVVLHQFNKKQSSVIIRSYRPMDLLTVFPHNNVKVQSPPVATWPPNTIVPSTLC